MSPQSLAQNFKNSTIPASYANFGFIPYGQSLMGKIHYDANDQFACEEFPDTELERTNDVTPFFLAERGDCSFVQKVRNMENIGVAVGIIIDNTQEDVENVLMSDDGTGGGIRIPSMLISSKDGKKLVNWYNSADQDELD